MNALMGRTETLAGGLATAGLALVTLGSLGGWPAPDFPPLPGAVYAGTAPRTTSAFALRFRGVSTGLVVVLLAAVAPIVLLTPKGWPAHVKIIEDTAALIAGVAVLVIAARHAGPALVMAGAGVQIIAVLWAAMRGESDQ